MDGPRLRIRIKPSERLRRSLLVGVALAVAAPWAAALPLFFTLLCAAVVLGFSVPVLRKTFGDREQELHLDAGGWSLQAAGVSEHVDVLPDSTVWPLLIVLRLRTRRHTHAIVLLPDSASPEEVRRLRVALRFPVGGSGNEDRVRGPV